MGHEQSYDPDALKLMDQAFDDAWQQIAEEFDDARKREIARENLAGAILELASQEGATVASLKAAALKRILFAPLLGTTGGVSGKEAQSVHGSRQAS